MKLISPKKKFNASKVLLISTILTIIILTILQINKNIQNRKLKTNLIENSKYFVEQAKKMLKLEDNIEIDEKNEYIVIDIETDKLTGYLAVLMNYNLKTNQVTYEYHIMTTHNDFKICGIEISKLNIDSIEVGNCCKNPKELLEIDGQKYTIGYQMTLKD